MTNVVFINNGSTVCLLRLKRLVGVAVGDGSSGMSLQQMTCVWAAGYKNPSQLL